MLPALSKLLKGSKIYLYKEVLTAAIRTASMNIFNRLEFIFNTLKHFFLKNITKKAY